jgi:hypothetical protein
MKDSRYYVLKLLASAIVASIYYEVLVSYGRKFDIAELLTNILLLYVGTAAVNSLSKKLSKKKREEV